MPEINILGKIRDIPPAIEKYHRSEIAQYTDCDCAVKMLPKYASEQAKTEFMHEIELVIDFSKYRLDDVSITFNYLVLP